MIFDTLWEIWYYFILYAVWVIFGLEFINKMIYYKRLKTVLGNNLNSFPDVSNLKLWRKIIFVFLMITAFAMLIVGIIYKMHFLLSIPIFIIAGLVYINGKLRNSIISYIPTIFWNEKGISVFPLVYKLHSPILFYDSIENINFIKKKSVEYGIIMVNNKEYKFVVNDKSKSILNDIISQYIEHKK